MDRAKLLNIAMFSQVSPSIGYILKPDLSERQSLTISVCIISAYMLPKPKGESKGEVIDPFVEMELATPDGAEKIKTQTIINNGLLPIFMKPTVAPQKQLYRFKTVTSIPKCSFLIFQIFDAIVEVAGGVGKGEFIAGVALPVSRVSTGYQELQILDFKGQPLPESRLLVYIERS